MDPNREDTARWLDEGRELLGMLHEQIDHLSQENERLRAELGRLDELQAVMRTSIKTMTDCGPSETNCWRPSTAWPM
jgi:prefoldin subunit 5